MLYQHRTRPITATVLSETRWTVTYRCGEGVVWTTRTDCFHELFEPIVEGDAIWKD